MLTAKEAHDKSVESYVKFVEFEKGKISTYIEEAAQRGQLFIEVRFPALVELDIVDWLKDLGYIINEPTIPYYYSGEAPKAIRIEW